MTRMRALRSAARRCERLGQRRDAERGRTAVERGFRDVDRAVPVALGLDDRPQLGALGRAQQRRGVPPDRPEVEGEARPLHAVQSTGVWVVAVERCGQQIEQVAGDESRRVQARGSRHAHAPIAAAAAAVGAARGPSRGTRPTTPVSTSPVPAVASDGRPGVADDDASAGRRDDRVGALEQDDRRRSAPPHSRAASSRCASTQAESRRAGAPSSPACGVRTVGASRSTGSSPKSASASTTAGRSICARAARGRARGDASPRPRPGPDRERRRPLGCLAAIVSTASSSDHGRASPARAPVTSAAGERLRRHRERHVAGVGAKRCHRGEARRARHPRSSRRRRAPSRPCTSCLRASRRGTRVEEPGARDACSVGAPSSPMSATTTLRRRGSGPARRRARPSARGTSPSRSASTAAPATSPVDASTPEGGRPRRPARRAALIRSIDARRPPGAAHRWKPVPKSASTTTS